MADSPSDINSELDEMDREEFYRLKKASTLQSDFPVHCTPDPFNQPSFSQVSNKKQRDQAAADKELQKQNKKTANDEDDDDDDEPVDVLGTQEDNDVIF